METRKNIIKALGIVDLSLLGINILKPILLGSRYMWGFFIPNYFPASLVLLVVVSLYSDAKKSKKKAADRREKEGFGINELFRFEEEEWLENILF